MPRSIVAFDFGGNFGEDVVRSKLMCLALSVLMSASLAAPAASQIPGDPLPPVPKQKPSVPKLPPKPIPPGLAKDCAAKNLTDSPKTTIVGPFATASFKAPLAKWVAEKAGVVVIAAPAKTPFKPLFSGEERMGRHYVGCIYDSRDGAYVLRRLTESSEFPPRTKRQPGEK